MMINKLQNLLDFLVVFLIRLCLVALSIYGLYLITTNGLVFEALGLAILLVLVLIFLAIRTLAIIMTSVETHAVTQCKNQVKLASQINEVTNVVSGLSFKMKNNGN